MSDKDEAKSSEGTSEKQVPQRRKIKNPYYLLRTGDGVSSFLESGNSQLFRNRKEPLVKFLGKAVMHGEGTREQEVEYHYRAIGDESPRPMRFLTSAQLEGFRKAATEFYNQAMPDSTIPNHEKRLRKHFRLPDPDMEPDCYIAYGPRLNPKFLVLWGCEKERNSSLHLTEHPLLDGELKPGDPTIHEKLKKKVPPWRNIAIGSGIAASIAAIAMFVLWLTGDKDPPEIQKITAENDPTRVFIEFNESIQPKSIQGTDNFAFNDENGAKILKVGISKESGKRLILETTPLESGPKYILSVKGVSDRSGNEILGGSEKAFPFLDTLPPEPDKALGDGGDLQKVHLFFNEVVDKQSAENTANYAIKSFSLNEATLNEKNPRRVALKFSQPFVNDQRYTLEIKSVRDASSEQNPIPSTIEFPFTYIDTLPPEVEKVDANGKDANRKNQLEVIVTFNEPVEEESASNPANYIIRVPKEDDRKVESVEILDERSAKLFLQQESPLFPGKEYSLFVTGVRDMAPIPSPMLQRENPDRTFRFTGDQDKAPPKILSHKIYPEKKRIHLEFDEAVKPGGLFNPKSYRIKDSTTHAVKDVEPVPDRPGEAVIVLSEALEGGETYSLVVDGLEDFFGNTQSNGIEKEIIVTGFIVNPYQDILRHDGDPIVRDDRVIDIQFFQDLDKASAEDPKKYMVSGNVVIEALLKEPTLLYLTLQNPLKKGTHDLSIKEVLLAGDDSEYGPQELDLKIVNH